MKSYTTKIFLVLSLFFVTTFLVACSSNNNEQEINSLQEQVNLLQTQNALLQQNSSQSSSNSTGDISVPEPPQDTNESEISLITPTPESLPTNPVMAGEPIIYDGWSMLVSKEIKTQDDVFAISVTIRNLGNSDRVFRYEINGVTISDDQGNSYNLYTPVMEDCESNNGVVTNKTIKAGESEEIYGGFGWGDCGEITGLDLYSGPIPVTTNQLLVHFNNFGPFSGITVIIDL